MAVGGEGDIEVLQHLDESYLDENGWEHVQRSDTAVDMYQDRDVGYTVSVSGDTLKARPYNDEKLPAFEVHLGEEYEVIEASGPDGAYEAAQNFVSNVLEQENRQTMDDPVAYAQNVLQSAYDNIVEEDPETIAAEMGQAADEAYEVLSGEGKRVNKVKLPDKYSVPTHLRFWYGKEEQEGPGPEQFEIELYSGDGNQDTQIAYGVAAKMLRDHHKKSQTNNGFVHKDHHKGEGGTRIVDAFDDMYEDIRLHNSGVSSR